MYRWKRRMLYQRIGILLTMAGYLFFFFSMADSKLLMMHLQLPLITYLQEGDRPARSYMVEMGIQITLPLTVYGSQVQGYQILTEDMETLENLLAWQEAQKPEQGKEQNRQNELKRQMEQENRNAQGRVSDNQLQKQSEDGEQAEDQTEDREEQQMSEEQAEDQTEDKVEDQTEAGQTDDAFAAAQAPAVTINLEAYKNFDALLENFYVIDKSTYIDASELDVERLSRTDLTIEKSTQMPEPEEDYSKTENPQILIYHTHSQEGYADSIAGDENSGVMGAGEELARLLTQEYGFRVLHHYGKYDVKSRDYAYGEAVAGLEQVLRDNPSIEVIIDLHRDGVDDGTHLVTDLNGKKTAQVMLFNGLSRTKKIGEIAYLKNENRAGNLAFSFQLQTKMMEYYPGLARKIYLKGLRYNMHYRPRSLLIELGAQTNTEEEARNALPPLAHCIAMVLDGDAE